MLQAFIDKGSADPFHWYARAMELRSLGRLDEALDAYSGVESKFPDYVPTYLMAAQVANELERPADALRWAERGIQQAQRAGEYKALTELKEFCKMLGQ